MVVRLRLARLGVRHSPKYRLVAADSRFPRDGRHLEALGHYNPVADSEGIKHVSLDVERIKYWLACGAQPSRPVQRLLGMAGILPRAPLNELTRAAENYGSGKHCRAEPSPFISPPLPMPAPSAPASSTRSLHTGVSSLMKTSLARVASVFSFPANSN